ncbi:nicotinate-nucleotide adenylyltransferase [Melghirimyces profundicolus]|uniref:Probable nicotinate-nucleotide adenylyltransferase n=1 Tax=Melghirimyces profundicolus TaxID=1242148 RepID=A0A2T6C921_9BACL|nr:nicotinate-nucleotide adenylyltransferase [Melghirimyces profundicolus]PTX64809.1 nicotinate-nucleotide adenylyltransferase [Melghirimyces profundicolus]
MKKRIGIYGGTFDPVHIGHLIVAEQARAEAGLDEIWFVPAASPPHKSGTVASAEDRFTMVELAVADHPAFRVSRVEMDRGGPSYTIDTVKHFADRHPGAQFHLIVGADMVLDLPHWYKIKEITSAVDIIGWVRPGYTMDTDRLPEHIKNRLTLITEGVRIDLSSTWIRERATNGESVRYLVPEPVRRYMEEHQLYEPKGLG